MPARDVDVSMTRKSRARKKPPRDDAAQWQDQPGKGKARPTPERLSWGDWRLVDSEIAGQKLAVDAAAHPIEALEYAEVLTSDQASAARDWESLYRLANEVGGIRDSTTLWEPKGYESDDGPVNAVRERRELYLALGTYSDQLLRDIILTPRQPKRREIEPLRIALDACCIFWKR